VFEQVFAMLPVGTTRRADSRQHSHGPPTAACQDGGMVDATHLDELAEATRRLVRTVDGMADGDYTEPSLLPDWTRGHVVAHLALNAEGLAGALRGLTEGRSVPMYASQEARDADIAALGTADPETIRGRLLGGVTDFTDAVAAVPEEAWDVSLDRTPGQRAFRARSVPLMRHREVEIHHADLGLAYTSADWPAAFSVRLIDSMVKHNLDEPMTLHAVDLDRTWRVHEGGPTVSGTASDLGWWVTGRGDGEGLRSDQGALPAMGAW
jgi:maleylpyruvate isomerase